MSTTGERMRFKLPAVAFLIVLLAAVSATPAAHASIKHFLSRLIFPIQVTTEYDRDARAGAKTYSWGAARMAVAQYTAVVKADVDHDLQKQGWQPVSAGGAVTVFVQGDVQSSAALEGYYQKLNAGWAGGWGDEGWGRGWRPLYGEATTVALNVPGNNLVIDMFDTQSHRLIFRSVAQEQLWTNDKTARQYLLDSVKKMLKKLPR
jgi:hypothetical protein